MNCQFVSMSNLQLDLILVSWNFVLALLKLNIEVRQDTTVLLYVHWASHDQPQKSENGSLQQITLAKIFAFVICGFNKMIKGTRSNL